MLPDSRSSNQSLLVHNSEDGYLALRSGFGIAWGDSLAHQRTSALVFLLYYEPTVKIADFMALGAKGFNDMG